MKPVAIGALVAGTLALTCMHPVAGNPDNYPETVDLIDDSDRPNASNFNVSHQGNLDRTAFLRKRTGTLVALNWQPIQSAASIDTAIGNGAVSHAVGAACWDPLLGVWRSVHIGQIGIVLEAWTAINTGQDLNWMQITAPLIPSGGLSLTHPGASIVADGTIAGTFYFALTAPGTLNGAQVYKCVGTGGPTTVLNISGVTILDTALIYFNGVLVFGITESSGASSAIYYSTDHGASWNHTIIATPPSSTKWRFAISNFSGTPHLHAVAGNVAAKSANGTTWTHSALGYSAAGGLAHAVDELGEAIYASTSTDLIRSGDGVTWTSRDASGAFNLFLDLSAVGNTLFAAVNSNAFGGDNVGALSLDGGKSWRQSQTQIVPTSSDAPKLATSGTQFCMWRDTSLRFSSFYGPPAAVF